MNVASLELCKELYEASGWDFPGEDRRYHYNFEGIGWSIELEDDPTEFVNRIIEKIPAYYLGYLLRKLPENISKDDDLPVSGFIHICKMNTSKKFSMWHAFYSYNGYRFDHRYGAIEDTPENAACKLAIELFKQNILKKQL